MMEIYFDLIILPGKKRAEAQKLIKAYKNWQLAEFGSSSLADEQCFYYESENRTLIILNTAFTGEGEELAREMSLQQGIPLAYLQLYKEEMWMYRLFENGRERDKFCPMPDYFARMSKKEMAGWQGNLQILKDFFPDISSEAVRNYLKYWDDDCFNQEQKSYKNDRFSCGIGWQVLDFIEKLGFYFSEELLQGIISDRMSDGKGSGIYGG